MAGSPLLKVDYEDLSTLDTKLTHIVNSMDNDKHTTSDLAAAVGDSKLAEKIREFGDSWSIHRGQIKEELEWMRDKVREIGEEFKGLDTELADGLKA